jgi:hypothetical protein
MDFWDLVKVMWRRWYVTAPMLLLTALAAGYIANTVGPQYQATGHVTVVPPLVQRQAPAGEVSRVNPWNEEALADAARIRLEGKSLHDELFAAGHSGEWAVEITGRLPVITIEVVAGTPDQALTTMHMLQGVVEEEVHARQAELNLQEGEEYTTVRYDQGESIETTNSRLRRALVAVLGAGLILTTGVVIAYDAIARWRRSRSPAAKAEEPRRRYMYGGLPNGANGANGRSGATEFPLPVKLHAEPAGSSPISPAPASSKPVSSKPVSTAPATTEHTQKLPVGELTQKLPNPNGAPEESTIILPLANVPWAGQKKNGDSKP